MSEEGSPKVKPDNIKQEAEESVLELAKGLEVGLKLDDTTEKKVQIEKPKEEKTEKASLKFKGLPDSSIESIAEYIKSGYGKNIIVLSGAGISTSAGIPDFRSPKTGLYANLKKYNLPYPEAIFVLSYFADKPEPFFTLAKELYPGSFCPTMSHAFIKLLSEKKLLLRNYTQNIDTLERVAGIDESYLIEAHGSFHEAHCIKVGCKKPFSHDWVKEKVFRDEIPKCDNCGSIVKPDIVFFGESLPEKFHVGIDEDFPKCDLLIVMGTSLKVHPFASLPLYVKGNVPRLLINREKVGKTIGGFEGFDFFKKGKKNSKTFKQKSNEAVEDKKLKRDAVFLGDCDKGCLELCKLLGWETELRDLHEELVRKHTNGNSTATESSSC